MTKPNPLAQKKRLTSKRPKGWWKRSDFSAMLKDKWANDPVFQEKMRLRDIKRNELRKSNPIAFTRAGVPNGMRRRTANRLWAKADKAADRFIQMLKDEGDLPQITVPDSDAGMAEAALKEAFRLAIVPGDLKIKSQNIRTILEWTKAKPESKSKVTVESAEDWLKEAKKDMEKHALDD